MMFRGLSAILLAGFLLTAAVGCSHSPSATKTSSGVSSSPSAPSSAASSEPAVSAPVSYALSAASPASPQTAASSRAASAVASSFPSPESDPRYVKAYRDYMSNSYDEAENICDAAIAGDPNCFWAYNIKGISHYFANGNAAASYSLNLINKSTDINPSYSYGYFNKALIQKGIRDWDDSLMNFNKVLSLKPGDTWAYYGIATVYADSLRSDQALQYLKLALDTDPSGVKAQAKDDITRHWSRLRHDARFTALTGIS